MNPSQRLEWRYSCKKFDPSKQISDEDRKCILETLQMSPSGTNLQPWYFYVGHTTAGRERIAIGAGEHFAFIRTKITDASMAILYCARTEIDDSYMRHLLSLEDQAGRYSSEEQMHQLYEARNNSADAHRKLGDLQAWIDMQVYLNMGFLLATVAQLGIDALAMESLNMEAIKTEFGLDEKKLKPLAVVSLGYRAEDDTNIPPQRPKSRLPQEEIMTLM